MKTFIKSSFNIYIFSLLMAFFNYLLIIIISQKLDDILSRHPTLEDTYNNYQTQLDSKQSFLDLFLAIPEELKLNKAPLTRSGMPGLPDKETTELTNIAVVILQSDNPPEKSNELLKPINEILKEQGNN